jgi:hypothetical protein
VIAHLKEWKDLSAIPIDSTIIFLLTGIYVQVHLQFCPQLWLTIS